MTKGVIGDIITLLSNAGKSKRLDFGKARDWTLGKVFYSFLKKYLTNEFDSDIILKLSRERTAATKSFLKKLEKVLDKNLEL